MPTEDEVQTMREDAVANLILSEVRTTATEMLDAGFYDNEWVRLVHLVDYLEQMTVGWPCVQSDTIEPLRSQLNHLYITGRKLD